MTDKDVKKNIEDLLEGIDEFDSKYITYNAKVHSKVLEGILDYIKRKEQECNDYKQALDEIENIADDYNRVEKTSQYYRDGFDQIQDIINSIKEQ